MQARVSAITCYAGEAGTGTVVSARNNVASPLRSSGIFSRQGQRQGQNKEYDQLET